MAELLVLLLIVQEQQVRQCELHVLETKLPHFRDQVRHPLRAERPTADGDVVSVELHSFGWVKVQGRAGCGGNRSATGTGATAAPPTFSGTDRPMT